MRGQIKHCVALTQWITCVTRKHWIYLSLTCKKISSHESLRSNGLNGLAVVLRFLIQCGYFHKSLNVYAHKTASFNCAQDPRTHWLPLTHHTDTDTDTQRYTLTYGGKQMEHQCWQSQSDSPKCTWSRKTFENPAKRKCKHNKSTSPWRLQWQRTKTRTGRMQTNTWATTTITKATTAITKQQ